VCINFKETGSHLPTPDIIQKSAGRNERSQGCRGRFIYFRNPLALSKMKSKNVWLVNIDDDDDDDDDDMDIRKLAL
jgi:hypothetical protein